MPKLLRFLPFLVIGVLATPYPSHADSVWQENSSMWKTRDACARQAHKLFPDYTKEANAQREKYRANCLRANNLPVDSDPSPPAPAPNQAVPQK